MSKFALILAMLSVAMMTSPGLPARSTLTPHPAIQRTPPPCGFVRVLCL